jgi:hypothetical protein
MAESNDLGDVTQRFVEKHQNCAIPLHSYLVVIESKGQYKPFEQGLIELCNAKNISLYIFHSADECSNFIISKVVNNELMVFTVHVQIELAHELIPNIAATAEVQDILVIGGRPPSPEERETMKAYSKVSYQISLI